MKAGDRVLIEINGDSHHCDVIASESKSILILVNEDGEQVATIQQFWRKTEPVLGQKPKHIPQVGKRTGNMIKLCEAPGCPNSYTAKKADIARGWGKTCSKSCAAKLREANKK